mgnify:CR=1 FL=1
MTAFVFSVFVLSVFVVGAAVAVSSKTEAEILERAVEALFDIVLAGWSGYLLVAGYPA